MQHWVKQHGAACLELADFAAQDRHVGAVAVSARADVGQTYLLEPGVEQVIDLHGSALLANETVMIVSGTGACGLSTGPVLTATADSVLNDVLSYSATLERGEYKVCFCDLDLVDACVDASSFGVQVGIAYASPLSCLADTPTFVRAACRPQGGGGLRCAYA